MADSLGVATLGSPQLSPGLGVNRTRLVDHLVASRGNVDPTWAAMAGIGRIPALSFPGSLGSSFPSSGPELLFGAQAQHPLSNFVESQNSHYLRLMQQLLESGQDAPRRDSVAPP